MHRRDRSRLCTCMGWSTLASTVSSAIAFLEQPHYTSPIFRKFQVAMVARSRGASGAVPSSSGSCPFPLLPTGFGYLRIAEQAAAARTGHSYPTLQHAHTATMDFSEVKIGSKTRAGGAKPREVATTGEVDRKVGAGNKASVDPDHRKIAALDRKSFCRNSWAIVPASVRARRSGAEGSCDIELGARCWLGLF